MRSFALLVLAGCGDKDGDTGSSAPEIFDLSVSGSGFEAYEGALLTVLLLETTDGVDRLAIEQETLTGGAFSYAWTYSIVEGHSYEVHVFADADGSCTCSAPPDDGLWMVQTGTVTQSMDLSVDVTGDEYPSGCANFFGDVCPG